MDVKQINMQKIMAMLAQPKEQLKPLTGISAQLIDVKYIRRDGTVDIRQARLYTPDNAKRPMPLVYVAHYEMPIDSLEIRDYLLKGWAVASCANFKNEYNETLVADDLVFNNAALYTLRTRSDIDENRIAVVGGSAGGYMSLMLNAMQLGICVSVANGPICNVHFNLCGYFMEANKFNLATIADMTEEEKKNPLTLMAKVPVPFVGAICGGGGFDKVMRYITDKDDMSEWEAISPTAFAECFCNPLYVNHATSDILVPIDQLTKKYTYDVPGETLPEGYNYRMGKVEGKLGYALCDRLDQSELNLFKVDPITDGSVKPYLFDKEKRYNVCVTDEGAPQSYASHNLGIANGRATDAEYIGYHFNLTSAKTNVLTAEKFVLFAERYAGKAPQLISHENVDDTAYGSLAVYRKEIIEELKKWKKDNGEKAFAEIEKQAIKLAPQYKAIIEEIGERL